MYRRLSWPGWLTVGVCATAITLTLAAAAVSPPASDATPATPSALATPATPAPPDTLAARAAKPPFSEIVWPQAGADSGEALAVSPSGVVYAVGYVKTMSQGLDVVVERLGANGWVRTYDGPWHTVDAGVGVALGRDGSVYVTGYTYAAGDADALLLKYSAGGDLRWVRTWAAGASTNDFGGSVVLDGVGDILVRATMQPMASALLKYSPAGTLRWASELRGAANLGRTYHATDLVVDGAGNAYLSGWTNSGAGAGFDDGFVASYSPTGAQRWTRRYDGPSHGDDGLYALCLRRPGGAIAVGSTATPAGDIDALVCAFTSTGGRTFSTRLGVGNGSNQWLNDVELDRKGEIAACGVWESVDEDFYVLLLRANGKVQWQQSTTNSPGDDWAAALVVDGRDRITVTGVLATTTPGASVSYTACYSRQANTIWDCTWGGPQPGPVNAWSIARYRNSKVWITGLCWNGPVLMDDRFVLGWKQ